MSRTDEFLDLYRRLEAAIESRGLVDSSRYDNMVWGYMQTPAGERHCEALNACREIRNLLSHNPDFEGRPIAQPSAEIVAQLKKITERVENPLRALDFAVREDGIFRAQLTDGLLYVMQEMYAKRYTHVPVFEGKRFYGVLSENSVFCYMLMHSLVAIDDLTAVSEIKEFLPTEKHSSERYEFADRAILFDELHERFEADYANPRRLAAVFVTEHGKPTEALLGMITPWDILGANNK